uniref:DUF834 domain-containing protein n=1 Tax=Oryza glaberrima TaxID=4538 RepID=A0A679BA25_ORYGL|nr:hypothetical protein [Oryza glaberrima]
MRGYHRRRDAGAAAAAAIDRMRGSAAAVDQTRSRGRGGCGVAADGGMQEPANRGARAATVATRSAARVGRWKSLSG